MERRTRIFEFSGGFLEVEDYGDDRGRQELDDRTTSEAS